MLCCLDAVPHWADVPDRRGALLRLWLRSGDFCEMLLSASAVYVLCCEAHAVVSHSLLG